jgi:hypothetical protein
LNIAGATQKPNFEIQTMLEISRESEILEKLVIMPAAFLAM